MNFVAFLVEHKPTPSHFRWQPLHSATSKRWSEMLAILSMCRDLYRQFPSVPKNCSCYYRFHPCSFKSQNKADDISFDNDRKALGMIFLLPNAGNISNNRRWLMHDVISDTCLLLACCQHCMKWNLCKKKHCPFTWALIISTYTFGL